MKNSLVKKLGIGVTATGIALGANSLDAGAQNKSDYKDIDKDGLFKGYSTNTNDGFQEKVFFNDATGKYDRFYIQHLDKDTIAALPFYGTMPIMDFKSGDVSHLVSDSMYVFQPIKERSFELGGSHAPGLCDEQILKTAGVEEGTNYISNSYVKNYFKKLPGDMVLELEDGKSFLVMPLPLDQQEDGKTNHLHVPFDDEHQWGVDPITKKLWVFGTIYRGILETGKPVMASASTGLVSRLGEKDSFAEAVEEAGEKETKERKKGSLYWIAGANGNDKFIEGQFGVQKGAIALVANYGLGKDETVEDLVIPMGNKGVYGEINKENQEIELKGISGELHALSNRKVSPFIGGGLNHWKYITKTSEKIMRDGEVLSQNTNSKPNSELSYKGKAGINFKIGEKSKLGVQAGYDTKAEFSGGVRFTRKF